MIDEHILRDAELWRHNCAILERTGDGRAVGRCWFYVGEDCVCPRHGDVVAVQEHYAKTGELTDENVHHKEKG